MNPTDIRDKTAVPTSAEVRAKHKKFLFASVANYYEESVVLESGKGSRLRDLDGGSTSTSSAASSR